MTDDDEVHTYRWTRAVVGLGALAVTALATLMVLGLGYAPVLAVITVLVMTAWFRWGTSLGLSEEGVTWSMRTARWSDLELVEQGNDLVLATRPDRGRGYGRVKARLRLYDPEWRTGPIGDDLRRWAPQLARRIT